MTHSDELKGYLEAEAILKTARMELIGSDALYTMVCHAGNHVTRNAAALLRGDSTPNAR